VILYDGIVTVSENINIKMSKTGNSSEKKVFFRLNKTIILYYKVTFTAKIKFSYIDFAITGLQPFSELTSSFRHQQ